MITFIVPLRSPRSTTKWPVVCQLLERTLGSICAQTCALFSVIVVCNEKPNIQFSHPSIEYVLVDFELTCSDLEDKHEFRRLSELDKARRMWTGLQKVKNSDAVSHIMFVDADDCISRKIVEFVMTSSEQSLGWYAESGYEYPENSSYLYRRQSNLWEKTNTSHVLRLHSLQLFANLPFEKVDSSFLFHQKVRADMEKNGFFLQPLPFKSVVYITDNGANMYMQRKIVLSHTKNMLQYLRIFGGYFKRFLIRTALSEDIRNEFGLYKI